MRPVPSTNPGDWAGVVASGYLLKFQEFLLLCTSGHIGNHTTYRTDHHWSQQKWNDQVGSLSISRCSSTSSTCEAFPASSKASMHCKVQMSIYLDQAKSISICHSSRSTSFLDFSICSRYVLGYFFGVQGSDGNLPPSLSSVLGAHLTAQRHRRPVRRRPPTRWEVDTATTSRTFREQGKSQIGTRMNRDEQGQIWTNMDKYGQIWANETWQSMTINDNQWQSMTTNDNQCLVWLNPWVISSNIKVHASSQLGIVQKHLRGTWIQNQPKSARYGSSRWTLGHDPQVPSLQTAREPQRPGADGRFCYEFMAITMGITMGIITIFIYVHYY